MASAGGALRAWLDDPALARRAAGAIALASADPLVVRALPPDVWVPVWQQGRAALDAGDPAGLPVALGVAGGHGPDAAAALELLDRRAGHPSCAVLPTSTGPLPGPGAELTVALRILAGRDQPCPGAGAVLERVLVDPRWGAATAAGELADLVTLARRDNGGRARAVLPAGRDAGGRPRRCGLQVRPGAR